MRSAGKKLTGAERWQWWHEIAFGRLGLHPDAFYALSIKEWSAALRNHVSGDGHEKTHNILADIAALTRNANLVKSAKPSSPLDFMPWRKPEPKAAAKSVDQKINAFFRSVESDHAAE